MLAAYGLLLVLEFVTYNKKKQKFYQKSFKKSIKLKKSLIYGILYF